MIADRVAATLPTHYGSLAGIGGLGAWSGPGADPGPPYTREKLRVMSLDAYRAFRASQPGYATLTDAQMRQILDDMYTYRLCWWAGICGPGEDPTVPLVQGTPDYSQVNPNVNPVAYAGGNQGTDIDTGSGGGGAVVIEGPILIDEPYTLPEQPQDGGSEFSQDGETYSGGSSVTPSGSASGAWGSSPAAASGSPSASADSSFGLSSELFGIPVWALGAGAALLLWSMSTNRKGYR